MAPKNFDFLLRPFFRIKPFQIEWIKCQNNFFLQPFQLEIGKKKMLKIGPKIVGFKTQPSFSNKIFSNRMAKCQNNFKI